MNSKGNLEIRVTDSKDHEAFRELALRISGHCRANHVEVRPYASHELPFFTQLPDGYKKIVLSQLRDQVDLYDAAISAGANLRNSSQLTWQAVRKYGFTPSYDFFDKIEGTDVVEIYANTEHSLMQIFRDLNFYQICSYSIEELVSRPLDELVTRDPVVVADIMKWSHLFFTQQVKTTVVPEINCHVIQETSSLFKYQVELFLKYYSPLFDKDKNVVAVAVVASARLLYGLSKLDEEGILARDDKAAGRPNLYSV